MIDKAVIPAAGLGTRLLPATKEQPKEMLPVFVRDTRGELCLKPLLQLIFEQLYDVGLREFCVVIGRGKRAIQDHFTQDYAYADYLRKRSRYSPAEELEGFYRRLDDSVISWVTQPEPKGFGEAVLRARSAIGDNDFLVHAGDAYIISHENAYFHRLKSIFDEKKSSAVLLIHELAEPRQKGVANVRQVGTNCYEVLSVVEKPEKPQTNLAIEPVYLFRPDFFQALCDTKPDKRAEVQVTDAIQLLISNGRHVHATKLLSNEARLDVGDADSYWETIRTSQKLTTTPAWVSLNQLPDRQSWGPAWKDQEPDARRL